ncbi:MAG: SpoIIE family protein phosphatase, partial [Clostridia bacterium]|nr:SpoIIE family protein phosphatase [Clostridia bacterium]
FFDCFMIDGAHIALAVADVSDKGIPAAMFMMLTKTLIKNELTQGRSPAEALNAVNRQLTEQNAEGMFVTVWLAVVNLRTGECEVVNAGHEDPLVKQGGGEWEYLRYRHHLALGITPKTVYQGHRRILNKGDSVFVFTDGVTEEMNAARERYGNDRLRDVLNSCVEGGAGSLVGAVKDDVSSFFAGVEQFDDITMLCFRYFGADSVTVAARNDSLDAVNEFILTRAERFGASERELNEIRLSVEEIFGNIVDYAYEENDGVVEIDVFTDDRTGFFSVTFRDGGRPFDPTAVGAPKLTSDTGQRQVGGLGIYLAKQMTDEIVYEYRDGKNVLTMRKRIAQTQS